MNEHLINLSWWLITYHNCYTLLVGGLIYNIFSPDRLARFSVSVFIFISFDNYHMRHPHLMLEAQLHTHTGQSLPLICLGICLNCHGLVQTEKLSSLSGVPWKAWQQIGLFAAGLVYMKNLILAECYMSLKRNIRASCVVCAGKSVASQQQMAFVLFRMWNGLSHCNINLNKISHQSLEISSWDANW